MLSIDTVRAFGSVLWIEGEEFGVRFDPPLQPLEVAVLRRKGAEAKGLSAEMKAALDTWMGGSPR